ncbi:hypothetical protein Bbelb_255600 [Branchiostoma belcheri]|nr:hypothetical protein Bbelb_255600 [Branchiostoma belcheri]
MTVSNLKDAHGNHPDLSFMDTILSEVEEVDLLGLTIIRNLTWFHHIDKMSTDAGRRLGLLRRVSPFLCPRQRATIYKSMVRSSMEYASTVWMGVSATSLSALDAIKKRAIKIINLPQDSPDKIQIQPLEQRRNVGALSLLHRMYHQNATTLLTSLLPEPYIHRRETRLSTSQHSVAFEPVKSSSSCHRRTFIPATFKQWNCLPQDIVKHKVNAYLSTSRQRPV